METTNEKMERLMKMTDYVLEQVKQKGKPSDKYNKISAYANFLKQQIKLYMFIPVSKSGAILTEPKNVYPFATNEEAMIYDEEFEEYKEAKEAVLFEGWELNPKDISKLENVICITRGRIQLSFFKIENQIFFDHLLNGTTKIIKTIEDLVPQQIELTN